MGQEAAATYGSPFWVTTRAKVILQMEAGIVDIGHTDLCQTLGWLICLLRNGGIEGISKLLRSHG